MYMTLGIVIGIMGIILVSRTCKGSCLGLFGLILYMVGISILYYNITTPVKMEKAVKDYINGKATVTYNRVYSDSILIKTDTIVTFK